MAFLDGSNFFQHFQDAVGNFLFGIRRDGAIQFADGTSQATAPVVGTIWRTARVNHTVTAGDKSGGFFAIAVTWATPMPDLNYTIAWSIYDTVGTGGKDYSDIDMHSVTVNGFTAVVDSSNGTAGDVVQIHAIAVHD